MATFETVRFEKADGIAWVTLDRPEVRNAINQKMQDELHAIWHELRYDDDVRCIVLAAEGESFCTGIDRGEAISEDNTAGIAEGNFPGYPTPFANFRWGKSTREKERRERRWASRPSSSRVKKRSSDIP